MTVGFIGAGNMGGAIISGLCTSGTFDCSDINVCDKIINDDIATLGVNICSMKDCVEKSDVVLLAVKPAGLEDVLCEIKMFENFSGKIYISIAAGYKTEKIEGILGDVKIIRVMPNLCLKAGEGMSVLAGNGKCLPCDIETAGNIFSSCGKVAVVKEELIDACTAINGSGPAYVFMFMEALADAAVKHGIDRETAYLLSAQTVLGSAKLMLDSGIHPAKLKDMVCSPGGTTIEAVAALESKNFRDAVISAVDACEEKARKMSQK